MRGFGGTAACTILISSRTMSVQSRETSHSLQKNVVYYTPSPQQKQTARKLSQWKQDSATRNRYYRGTCKTLQIREGQRPQRVTQIYFACILKSEAVLSAPFLRNGLNRKPCTIFEIGGCPMRPPQENEIFYIGLLTRSCQVQVLSRICACDGATP